MSLQPLKFEPLYFGDRLTVVNPHGVVGVVTLWSKPEYVISRFKEAGVDLNPETSPIAVFGTLYGNGLREMLRNLLYNPQIQVLLICGHDRSGSKLELENFFSQGVEIQETSPIHFLSEAGMVYSPLRIQGTHRLIDPLVVPDRFKVNPLLEWLGDPKEESTLEDIKGFFTSWEPHQYTVSEEARAEDRSDTSTLLPR